MQLNNITVFCGSSSGTEMIYKDQAYALGSCFAHHDIGLVYGGAKVGLMGAVASGVLDQKGRATGVIPKFLQSVEIAHTGLTDLIVVETMHQRKAKMEELSDGFIALPGGFGTLEELFEILTWGQLGLHKKPLGLLNINGFYDALLTMMDVMVAKGFLKQVNRNMVLVDDDMNRLIHKMHKYEAPLMGKWLPDNNNSLKQQL